MSSYSRQSFIRRGYGAMKKCFVMASPFLLLIAGADSDGNLLQRKLHSICNESGRCLRYLCDIVVDMWNYGISQIQGIDILDSKNTADLRMVLASLVIGTYSLLLVMYLWKRWEITRRIKLKQESCKASISRLKKNIKQLPSKQVDDILNCNFNQLRSKLQKGEVTAKDVLTAYQGKTLVENERVNFIVDVVEEAWQMAEECDKSHSKDRPLHGIPISLKENYLIKGYHCTGGISRLLNQGTVKDDGVLVKVLKHQGAVPFVRTNIPQSMMTFECSNPLYGCTVNPHNLKRGPGGSSGGEGAVLGAEASILGWGSDIGGSLRIPSHFCGITCLKPTAGRLGAKSNEELYEGLVQDLVYPTAGPMARDVDTLVAAMQAVLCPYHFELDPEVPPIPFNTKVYESTRPLRIGYYYSDGYVTCIPGVQRGLGDAIQALKNRGHELVEFQVPDVKWMFVDLFLKACFGDGSEHIKDMFAEDEVDSTVQLLVLVHRLPRFVQTCMSYLGSWISKVLPSYTYGQAYVYKPFLFDFERTVEKDSLQGEQMRAMQGVGSVTEWWQLAGKIMEYRQSFTQHWKDLRLDAIVCPTMPYVAPPTGAVKYLIGGVTYTTLYNLLNFPSGCVPVTKVTAVDEIGMKDYPCNMGIEKFIKKYFSAGTGGLPVTVQCVGLPYQEELVLRVMKEVEVGLKSLK